MDIKETIQSQYLASLEMLKNAVTLCPEWLWADPKPKNKFWHIAYHALFFTHLYLQTSEHDFKAWRLHRENYESMGPRPGSPQDLQKSREPYTPHEVLEYLAYCQQEVRRCMSQLDLEQPQSGFSWLPFSKLELQFYNIRHLQLHTGELCERLGTVAGVDVGWVGMVRD